MAEHTSRPMHRPGGHMRGGEKAKDFKGTMGKLTAYIGRYKIPVLIVLVLAAGSTVFNVVGPKILGQATTAVFEGLTRKISGNGGIDFSQIGGILLLLLGLYVLSAVLSFLQGWVMTGVSQRVTYRMRKEISEKISRMPLGYFESRPHGEVLSRVTNDVDTLGQSLNQSITQLITSVTTMVGVLVMMLSISVWMTLVALLILPVSAFLVMQIVRRSQRYFRRQQNTLGTINGQIEETFGGTERGGSL